MMTKRYLLALLGFSAVWFISGLAIDALPLPASATKPFENLQQAQQQQSSLMFWLNALSATQTLLCFCVGAFLLRRNAWVPGLLVYALMSINAIGLLYKVALPAQPNVTMVGVVTENISGWVASVVACIAGLFLGQKLASYRRQAQAPG